MSGRLRNLAAAVALGAGVALAVFFAFFNHHGRTIINMGGAPVPVLVANRSIAKGTSGEVIAKELSVVLLTSALDLRSGAFWKPSQLRGKVALRQISRLEQLTSADFGPISGVTHPLTGH
jgi:flagella basal body P-ring formation protein FlgA